MNSVVEPEIDLCSIDETIKSYRNKFNKTFSGGRSFLDKKSSFIYKNKLKIHDLKTPKKSIESSRE